jgi:hypothetical protein
MKRSGKTILSAIASEQLYDETSTPRAGTVLGQAEFIPGFIQQLQHESTKVIDDFEAIRQTRSSACTLDQLFTSDLILFLVTRPEGIRFSVTGNILDIQSPKKPWRDHFGNLVSPQGYLPTLAGITWFDPLQNQTTLQPVPSSDKTLSDLGKKPASKVRTSL